MKFPDRPLARVTAQIPVERVDMTLGDGSVPQIGDIGEVDHIFTDPSGDEMYIVVCASPDGRARWVADMLASEFAPVPRGAAGT